MSPFRRHLTEDACLDLLHDLLPLSEREQALEHVRSCVRCERLLQGMALDRERLRARRAQERAGTGARRAAAPAWRAALSWAASLAVLGLVAVAVLWPRSGGPPPPPVAGPEAAPADARLAGASFPESERSLQRALGLGAAGPAFTEALAAYSSVDYARAAELLERLQVPEGLEAARNLYLGSALAMTGRYAESARILEGVTFRDSSRARLIPEPWSSCGRWTLAIALDQLGCRERADSLLAELAGEPGPFRERAREEQLRRDRG